MAVESILSMRKLLVEGKNDFHVIKALCSRHSLPSLFTLEEPRSEGLGVESLVDSLPVQLKVSGLNALGVVVDADLDIQARWDSIRAHLDVAGYGKLPKLPEPTGAVVTIPGKPKVGIWLMPNNHLPGTLEDFVAHLISEDDLLRPEVANVLSRLESLGLNKYSKKDRQKAFIHTWLAWQRHPGQPIGQAITAHVLQHDGPLAMSFVNWLNNLFVAT